MTRLGTTATWVLLWCTCVWANVILNPPPTCYKSCLSSILTQVGCSFADLNCYCGTGNTAFTGPLVGCVNVNCSPADASSGASCTSPVSWPYASPPFLAGACAVLTSGQTTLPNSLATLIPTGTATQSSTSSVKVTGSGTVSSPSPTRFSTVTTTFPSGGTTQSTTLVKEGALATTNNSGPSTGALIGGIVGGVVGFMILALLLMSVALYILVRRSVEKRQAENQGTAAWVKERPKHSPSQSRSSVAASDSPEDELSEMEPTFWGVVTRPKQALRVVNA